MNTPVVLILSIALLAASGRACSSHKECLALSPVNTKCCARTMESKTMTCKELNSAALQELVVTIEDLIGGSSPLLGPVKLVIEGLRSKLIPSVASASEINCNSYNEAIKTAKENGIMMD